MKTRYFLFALILLLLAAGAIYFYKFHLSKEKPDVWTFVPQSAIMVYESDDVLENFKNLKEKPVWNIFSALPFFTEVESNTQKIDSLAGKEDKLADFLHNKQILISIHPISKDDLDFIYFFELSNISEQATMQEVLKAIEDQSGISKDKREYNGFNINEIRDSKSGKRFSYLIYKNFFMGSYTPFLVEDIIRNINEQQNEGVNFRQANYSIFSVPKLTNDEGNLYLNFEKVPLLLSTFTDTKTTGLLQRIGNLCNASFFDIDVTDQQVMLNGFSAIANTNPDNETDSQPIDLLQAFQAQKPRPLNMQDYVPEETAVFYHFTFNQPKIWQKNFSVYLQSVEGTQERDAPTIEAPIQDEIFSWISGEVGLAMLESVDIENPDQLFITSVTDTSKALQTLTRLSSPTNDPQDTLMYKEFYGDFLIRELDSPEFPAAVFGPLFSGFGRCFFTFTDDYLIMGNSINAIKKIIIDQEMENTWRKSVKQNVFLESINDQANISVIFNTARVWNMLNAHLSAKWKPLFDQYSNQLKAFERVAVQFTSTDDQFYTSLAMQYRQPDSAIPQDEQYVTEQTVQMENLILTKPFVVRSADNLRFDAIVQDSSGIYLTTQKNGIAWKDTIRNSIISDLFQIDFYNNGKQQYLFATKNAVYVIDNHGDVLDGYPIYMPDSVAISRLSLIDYDNSKRYRFLVTDVSGNLYMFNKDRENLEGWTPRFLTGPLASDPFHLRVRGKDMIIAAQKDGKIFVLNRQGEPYPGFPLDLKNKLSSPLFVSESSNFANTVITTITENGEINAFNLNGNFVRKEQLYRPSTQTFFKLCIDALGNSYTIARQDLTKISVLDRNGTLLFEKNYISPGALNQDKLKIQYYNFGAGNEVYAITDKVQEFTYLYDAKGRLYTNRPFESGFEIGLIYSETDNSFKVFRNYGNDFSIISFGRSS